MAETLQEIIKKLRPNLSDNTIRTYISIIRSLHRKMNPTSPYIVSAEDIVQFFRTQHKKVLEYLKDVDFNKRKTILASLVVLCGDEDCVKTYREQMLKDATKYNEQQRGQTKSQSQKDNWMSQDNVMKIYRKLYKDVSPLFRLEKLTPKQLQELQNLVILSVYTQIPPRRLLDYTSFKLRNVDKAKDNFMDKRTFVFNQYKTANKYNQQTVQIPQRLRNIILKWESKHKNDYLLFDENGKPLSAPRLTLKLNKIFGGKKISVNMLRHIFITDEVLDNAPALRKMDEIAEQMGHSTDQQALYRKL